MFSHIVVGTNDPARAKTFYDALFGAIGGKPGTQDDTGRIVYMHRGNFFMVTPPINGEPACHANGGTVGFTVDDPAQADAWHRAAVENGGTSVENPPGVRQGGFGALYLAYVRDPDGNKLCATHRMPA